MHCEEESIKRQGPDYHKIIENREYLPKSENLLRVDSGMEYYKLMAEDDENVKKQKTS